MLATIRPLVALLLGVAFLLGGAGLLSTLVLVRGQAEGFSDQTLGLVMSAYFSGFFLGTFAAPNLIQRIGHIRSFAFFACACTVVVLLHPVIVNPTAWGLLRLASGFTLVGLYTVIESWLNAAAPGHQRSQVFGAYMAVNLGALAAGQWLLGVAPLDSFVLFTIVAVLICMAALPVTASRMTQPELPASVRLRMPELFRLAPAAAAGALLAGLATGGFWGLTAVYATHLDLPISGISALISLTIVGGAILQVPIGRVSDGGDRRTTLALVSALAAVLAIAMMFSQGHLRLLYGLFFLFGGLVFALYPLCVAHLLDHLPAERVLAGCSSLLLLSGIGSAIGPAVAGALMQRLGAQALPAFFAVTCLSVALVAGGRRLLRRRRRRDPAQFHAMLRTTPTAFEMLPDTDEAESQP